MASKAHYCLIMQKVMIPMRVCSTESKWHDTKWITWTTHSGSNQGCSVFYFKKNWILEMFWSRCTGKLRSFAHPNCSTVHEFGLVLAEGESRISHRMVTNSNQSRCLIFTTTTTCSHQRNNRKQYFAENDRLNLSDGPQRDSPSRLPSKKSSQSWKLWVSTLDATNGIGKPAQEDKTYDMPSYFLALLVEVFVKGALCFQQTNRYECIVKKCDKN